MKGYKLAILIALLAGVIFSILVISLSSGASKEIARPAKAAPSALISYRGLPARILIPSINVDAAVEFLGIARNGDMAVPDGSINVGWYKYGPIPGDRGSSVIAGHVVGLKGEPGVFFNLDNLQAGALVQVVDAKGQSASFTVQHTESFDQTQQPADIFSSTSGTHLNLITCTGDWDALSSHYLKRLVVFTNKTPDRSLRTSDYIR